MSPQQFITEVAEIVEAEPKTLSMGSLFREEADFWSSLVGFALLTFLEDQCGAVLSVDEFIACETVGDLYAKIPADGE